MRNEENKINIDHGTTVKHISSLFKGEMPVQLVEPPSQAWICTVLNVQEEYGKGQTRKGQSAAEQAIATHYLV